VVPGLPFDREMIVRLHLFLDAIKSDNFTLECMLCAQLQCEIRSLGLQTASRNASLQSVTKYIERRARDIET
jgi:hypothetical protein